MGKSGPIATFQPIFLRLVWPWVGELVGFMSIFICFPTQQNLVNRKHPTNSPDHYIYQGCVIPPISERTCRIYCKLAKCGNPSQERQPKTIKRRKIRGWITIIPCLKIPPKHVFPLYTEEAFSTGGQHKNSRNRNFFLRKRLWLWEPLREPGAGVAHACHEYSNPPISKRPSRNAAWDIRTNKKFGT